MRGSGGRAIPAVLIGALALGVLYFGLPQVRTPAPAARLSAPDTAAEDRWSTVPQESLAARVDTLRSGETLSRLLARGGLTPAAIIAALDAAALDPRRLPSGMPVTMRGSASDSLASEIVLELAVDRRLHLRRTADGWTSEEIHLPWVTDTVVVAGVITSTLYEALDSGAVSVLPAPQRAELAWSLADMFEYRVDMSRDLRQGDAFRALFLRATGPAGVTRIDRILAARFLLSGERIEAIRYGDSTRAEYFDQHGKSLRAAFLRAPLAFRRISSVFGRRRHPILGVWRQHRGMDYAAAAGTPVRSVGDGHVIFAGHRGGYGNVVEVRHRNGYVSRYGHLRGFARGARRGTRVGIGQTVGFVGSTGLSTAPHLHFEMLVNGVHRDPRVALSAKGGFPIPTAERTRFNGVREMLLAVLDRQIGPERMAVR